MFETINETIENTLSLENHPAEKHVGFYDVNAMTQEELAILNRDWTVESGTSWWRKIKDTIFRIDVG